MAARLDRQAIFNWVGPPDTEVALDEAVLHRLIGSAQVMHDALVQVAEMSQRPYLVVQVVPAANGMDAGPGEVFDVRRRGPNAELGSPCICFSARPLSSAR